MRKPNFFIMGAPKCGTTSMYRYLSTHPSVFVPDWKEPHYFATDLPARRLVASEVDYLGLFAPAQIDHSAIGEASTWYLYSREAAGEIREFCPDARLVVFFRNPVEFVQSLHDQLSYDEGAHPDFPKAWRHDRASFLEYGAFGTQMGRLLGVFPREQILVVLLDDLVAAPRVEYLRVLRHLGLADDGRQSFGAYNARKIHRSNRLEGFIRRTPEPVARLWFGFKQVTGLRRLGALEWLSRANSKVVARDTIMGALRSQVRQAFSGETALLGRLIERDLSHWM